MAALTNPTAWVLAGAVLVVAVAAERAPTDALAAYLRWLSRPVVFGVLVWLVVLHVGSRIVLGLVAPGDFSGEIVAARSAAAGEGLYAADLADAVRALDDTRGAWTVRMLESMPQFMRAEVERRRHGRIAAQAHPPALLAALVPLVNWLGPEGAYAGLSLVTIVAAAWTARHVMGVLGAAGHAGALAPWLAVAWQPVLAALRDGQISIIVSALALGAWLALRIRDDRRAGALLGAASALKVYPILLMVPLAFGARRALALGLVTLGAVLIVTMMLVPDGTWSAYVVSARAAYDGHWKTFANLSILARFGQFSPKSVATLLWIATGSLLVVASVGAGRERGSDDPRAMDLPFARFSCLAVLLSPLAWHHYAFLLVLPLGLAWQAAVATGRRLPVLAVLVAALMLSLPVADTSGMWTAVAPGRVPGVVLSPTTAVFALWLWLVRARPVTAP